MKKKATKKRLVIDIKNDCLFFCVGSFDGASVHIDKVFKKDLNFKVLKDAKISDEELLAETIKKTLSENNVKIKDCYTYIVGADIIRKTLVLPYVENEKDLSDLVEMEITQVMPMDLENFIIKHKYVSESFDDTSHKVKLNCAVVNKDIVEAYRRVIKLAGLKPIVLDMTMSTLENLVKFIIMSSSDGSAIFKAEIEKSLVAFADINESNCSIYIFKQGVIDFSRIIKTPNIDKKIIDQLNITKTIEGLNEEAYEAFNDVISEINMVIKYYIGRERVAGLDELFLFGEVSGIKGFAEYTQDVLQLTTNNITQIQGIIEKNNNVNNSGDGIASYINAIGGLIRW